MRAPFSMRFWRMVKKTYLPWADIAYRRFRTTNGKWYGY